MTGNAGLDALLEDYRQRQQLEQMRAARDALIAKIMNGGFNLNQKATRDAVWGPKILPLPPGWRAAHAVALQEAELQIEQGKWVMGL